MNKRAFIRNFSLLSMATVPGIEHLDQWISLHDTIPAGDLAKDEAFWEGIRKGYLLKNDYVNLENGYYCFLPQDTLEHFIMHVRKVNLEGSYYMRTVQAENKKVVAARLARLAGCASDELIITRNATESLDLVIGGTHWKQGDEAVMAEQDYGSMLDMFKQVAARYGVVNTIVSVPNHPGSDEEIVNLYAAAITPRTKLLMVSHMINITGQILPVKKICEMAHSKGVKVMVDGAHAFAHFQFTIPELGCDYYGASLHKWLSTPLGAGMLYIRKDNIPDLWPVFAEAGKGTDDILRLNHTGTHPVHTDLAIANALDYYLQLGPARKEARLRFLQQYWSSRLRAMPHVVVNTPADPGRHCGIGNAGIPGIAPNELAKTLLDKYQVYTVAIDYANVHGCRITPNVYTTPRELDKLVAAFAALGKAN